MSEKTFMVPYVTLESMADRYSKTNARLWVLCILLVVLLVGTNGAWLWYESQFVYEQSTTIEAEQDGEGVNIIGGGDVNYGAEGAGD